MEARDTHKDQRGRHMEARDPHKEQRGGEAWDTLQTRHTCDTDCRTERRPGRPRTLVMVAAWWRRRDMVGVLVRHGADVSLVDGVGNNILHFACLGGDRETVEFVLSLDGVDVNAMNNRGRQRPIWRY